MFARSRVSPAMENWSRNWPARGWRRGRAESDGEEEEVEEDGEHDEHDGGGVRGMEVDKRAKKVKRWKGEAAEQGSGNMAVCGRGDRCVAGDAAAGSLAVLQHQEAMRGREMALAAMGISNRDDPLTGVPLEPRKPVALLVSEDGGTLAGFDLHSLYHVVLKKGKTWFKTLAWGRFRVQPAETVSLCNDYCRYYGSFV